jgi:hypothetical protein
MWWTSFIFFYLQKYEFMVVHSPTCDHESWKSMLVTNKEINAPLPNQILPTVRRFPPLSPLHLPPSASIRLVQFWMRSTKPWFKPLDISFSSGFCCIFPLHLFSPNLYSRHCWNRIEATPLPASSLLLEPCKDHTYLMASSVAHHHGNFLKSAPLSASSPTMREGCTLYRRARRLSKQWACR